MVREPKERTNKDNKKIMVPVLILYVFMSGLWAYYSEQWIDHWVTNWLYFSVVGALSVLWLYFRMLKAQDSSYKMAGDEVVLRDRLQEKEEILRSMFDDNPNVIVVFNKEGRISNVNQTCLQLIDRTKEEVQGLPFSKFIVWEEAQKAREHFQFALQGHSRTFETAIYHSRGYRIDFMVTLLPVTINGRTDFTIAICKDITDNKRAIENVRHMAYYDDLTGMPNRRFFRERLDDAIANAQTSGNWIAVLFLDIDRFKLINDSLGHDFGNMLLLQIAERLTHCVDQTDIVARMEGDEFALFYPQIRHEEEIAELAHRILEMLQKPFLIQDYNLHITASIGIAVNRNDIKQAHTLIKYADLALSKAKDLGKNNYQFYSPAMNDGSLRRLTMENDLRRALEREEFLVYFQPQADIETGRLVGAEALIRWMHPKRGEILPGKFISIAEENGQIVSIGAWMLRKVCRQNKAWQIAGLPPIPIAVNLSIRQFLQPNLVKEIAAILHETQLEPKYLELEITESMTMDVDHAVATLRDLKNIGVKISVDDFGTGYSSLSYFRKFPIDKLKIDRSFVRDIELDPNDAAIVTTIVSMARHLNLNVIAEGVETLEQLQFLKMHQCNEFQGYLLSPPLPQYQFEQLYAASGQAAACKLGLKEE